MLRRRLPTSCRKVPMTRRRLPMSCRKVPMVRQRLPTSRQKVPMNRRRLPMSCRKVPMTRQRLPTSRPKVPMNCQRLPMSRPKVPMTRRRLPTSCRKVPMARQRPPMSHPKVPTSGGSGLFVEDRGAAEAARLRAEPSPRLRGRGGVLGVLLVVGGPHQLGRALLELQGLARSEVPPEVRCQPFRWERNGWHLSLELGSSMIQCQG